MTTCYVNMLRVLSHPPLPEAARSDLLNKHNGRDFQMRFKRLRRQMRAKRQAGPNFEGSDLLTNDIKQILEAMKTHGGDSVWDMIVEKVRSEVWTLVRLTHD